MVVRRAFSLVLIMILSAFDSTRETIRNSQDKGGCAGIKCLVPRSHRNAGLQPLLHAAVREDDPQTSDAKWARGSRSQTHRRAAKGGFTQGDVKVRRPRPDRTLLFLCCSEKLCPFESPKTNSDPDSGTGPTPPVTVLRVKPIAGECSREHCPRVYAICRPELG